MEIFLQTLLQLKIHFIQLKGVVLQYVHDFLQTPTVMQQLPHTLSLTYFVRYY